MKYFEIDPIYMTITNLIEADNKFSFPNKCLIPCVCRRDGTHVGNIDGSVMDYIYNLNYLAIDDEGQAPHNTPLYYISASDATQLYTDYLNDTLPPNKKKYFEEYAVSILYHCYTPSPSEGTPDTRYLTKLVIQKLYNDGKLSNVEMAVLNIRLDWNDFSSMSQESYWK